MLFYKKKKKGKKKKKKRKKKKKKKKGKLNEMKKDILLKVLLQQTAYLIFYSFNFNFVLIYFIY